MAIHIETVGYISIDPSRIEDVREWMHKHQLSDMDCRESEILTDVDEYSLKCVAGDFVSKEEVEELLAKCSTIKFFW